MTDRIAIGAMSAMRGLGLRPGVDVAIIGHDNIPASPYADPPLATMELPLADVGRGLAQKAIALINGASPEDLCEVRPVQLIWRASAGLAPSDGLLPIKREPSTEERMRLNVFAKVALAGAAAFITVATTPARAQEVLFLSTQLRPVEEAQKVRQVILRGGPAGVNFLVEEPSPFTVRMNAETQAGKRTISMVGALHGELQPLVGSNTLDNVDDLVASATCAARPPV